jgi:hypothetical protein
MFSNLVRSQYGVDGSGLLIGVIDTASGDLPSGVDRIVFVSDLSASECCSS